MADLVDRPSTRPDVARHLHRLAAPPRVTPAVLGRARAAREADEPVPGAQPVLRAAELVSLDDFTRLMSGFGRQASDLSSASRAESDAWLAPRLHAALRLTRREAADGRTWQLLAGVHPVGWSYTRWRWANDESGVSAIRLVGRVNQQALARLWWGAELFRDGSDYGPVVRAFRQSELPNLCLHRPFVRNRAFALAVVDHLAPHGQPAATSDEIGALARNITLTLPTLSLAAATAATRSSPGEHRRWVHGPAPVAFDELPIGPDDGAVPAEDKAIARAIVHHVAALDASR